MATASSVELLAKLVQVAWQAFPVEEQLLFATVFATGVSSEGNHLPLEMSPLVSQHSGLLEITLSKLTN